MEIDSTSAATAAAAPAPNERTGLGQEDFLRMLLTQIEHQDPLEPQDPTEFTAQLAQFTTLEQLVAIREGIDGLGASTATASDLAALASLVGREVAVRSDQLELPASFGEGAAPPPIEVELLDPAENLRVSVRSASGSVVHSFDTGPLSAGRHALAWDGRDGAGQPLAPGLYTITATAGDDAAGARVQTLVRGRARAIAPGPEGSATLEVGALRVSSNDVVEVRQERELAAAPATGSGS